MGETPRGHHGGKSHLAELRPKSIDFPFFGTMSGTPLRSGKNLPSLDFSKQRGEDNVNVSFSIMFFFINFLHFKN